MALFFMVAALGVGCGGGPTEAASLETKCEDWVSGVGNGRVVASKEVSDLVGSVGEVDSLCFRADALDLIGKNGSLTAGALRLISRCEDLREGCYQPGSELDLIEDKRFLRLDPSARLVMLIGYLRYADEIGEVRPSSFIGSVFANGRSVKGVEAWSRDAAVPPSSVRSAIAAAKRVGLIRQERQSELPPFGRCQGETKCETVYKFRHYRPYGG